MVGKAQNLDPLTSSVLSFPFNLSLRPDSDIKWTILTVRKLQHINSSQGRLWPFPHPVAKNQEAAIVSGIRFTDFQTPLQRHTPIAAFSTNTAAYRLIHTCNPSILSWDALLCSVPSVRSPHNIIYRNLLAPNSGAVSFRRYLDDEEIVSYLRSWPICMHTYIIFSPLLFYCFGFLKMWFCFKLLSMDNVFYRTLSSQM